MMRKGAIVISETVLVAFGVIISFVLLGTFGSMIFSGQSEAADISTLALVAKDIAWRIDNVAAEAGGVAMVYNLPKGINADIHIDYKRAELIADKKSYAAPFQALTHTKPYTLKNPQHICIVKNQDDMRISLSKDKCICNTADKRCDPACVVAAYCDPACNVDGIEDRVCDRRCSKEGDGICDMDCFTNEKDVVNEAMDCIDDLNYDDNGYKKSVEEDRICDADSHNVVDYICDIDCQNNGTSFWGICDPDCSKYGMYLDNGVYYSQDGFCDLDCGYVEVGYGIKELYEDSVCDLDCATAIGICDPDCGDIDDDCGFECVTSCFTDPGCRNGLTDGHIVEGECCGAGSCYKCDDGYNWDEINDVCVISEPPLSCDYYVDTDSLGGPSSDSNPGTLTQPWETLKYAESRLSDGDVVCVRGGVYKEYFTIDVPNVVFQNYNNELPIVDGSLRQIEKGVYHNLIIISADGVKIDGFKIGESAGRGVYIDEAKNVIIKNCEISENYRESLVIIYNSDNALIEDCDIHSGAKLVYEFCDSSGGKCRETGWDDPAMVITKFSTGVIFRRTKIHDSYNEGINFDVGTNNLLIEHCEIYGNKKSQLYLVSSKNHTVRYNLIYGVNVNMHGKSARGVALYLNHEDQWVPQMGDPLVSNFKIYGNLIANSNNNVYIDSQGGTQLTNAQIYNNVIIEGVNSGFVVAANAGGGHSFKNNIIWQTGGQIANIPAGKVDCDNNLWSRIPDDDAKGPNDPPYAVPKLKKTSGWDNLAGGVLDGSEFVIQSTSPAIDKGTNLGSPYNQGLNPASTWPNSVSTLDQNSYGSGWEIGAYVHGSASADTTNILFYEDFEDGLAYETD